MVPDHPGRERAAAARMACMTDVTDVTDVTVRAADERDAAWIADGIATAWASTQVARFGEVVEATTLPALVAELGGERAGHLTYAVRGDECEVVTLLATVTGRGVGRALMTACAQRAAEQGCRRLWLITTNDNVAAFAFYQRIGMDLRALHRDDVTRARELKPAIPLLGIAGVPIRHALEFELGLPPEPR
jgi:ribosomal protein S18 acetylase RimI-like enzyme